LFAVIRIIPAILLIFMTAIEQCQITDQTAKYNAIDLARQILNAQNEFIQRAEDLLLVLSLLPEIQNGE
jgi:hypothetical protein